MILSAKDNKTVQLISYEHFRDDEVLREKLADLEHSQWMAWSKSLDEQLFKPRDGLPIAYPEHIGKNFIEKKDKWLKLWKPYHELTEEEKDLDRKWGDIVLEIFEGFIDEMIDGVETSMGDENRYDEGYRDALLNLKGLFANEQEKEQ